MKPLAKIGLAFAAVFAIAVAGILVFRGGDEAAVKEALGRMMDDARAGATNACIGHIIPGYFHNGESYDQVCQLVRRYVGPGRWTRVDVRDLSVDAGEIDARAGMVLMLESRDGPGIPLPLNLTLFLKKVDGVWKVAGYAVEERR